MVHHTIKWIPWLIGFCFVIIFDGLVYGLVKRITGGMWLMLPLKGRTNFRLKPLLIMAQIFKILSYKSYGYEPQMDVAQLDNECSSKMPNNELHLL